MAFGSVREVEYQLSIAARLGYLATESAKDLARQADETAKVLVGLLRSLRSETWFLVLKPLRQRRTSLTPPKGYLSGVEPPPSGSQPDVQKPLHHRHHLVVSAPTRTRTRNTQLEAGHDFHFTIGACFISTNLAEGKGFEPSSRRAGTALAERPGQPYPATFRFFFQWTHRESNSDFQTAGLMSSRWTMSPSTVSGPPPTDLRSVPANRDCLTCKPGVVPLDQQPVLLVRQRSVRELNPAFLLTEEACGQ